MDRSLQIAVADDDAKMRSFYSRVLRSLGHQTNLVVSTGARLIQQCRTHPPDLIVLETKLPDMDGLTVAEAICRERPVPVIFVCSDPDPALIENAQYAHIAAYLVKPITPAHLEPAIALAVRRFEQVRALAHEVKILRDASP